ncbi:MAG: GSCFA domain-containing protein [Lentisphaerae bacterium]|nr:GSCFA domain-containing protein [Lentisphaerota bacterium]
MNHMESLKKVLDKYFSFEYPACLQILQDLNRDIAQNGISFDMSEYADSLLEILMSTEKVHQHHLELSKKGNDFILAYTHVIKEIFNLLETLTAINNNQKIAFAKIYYLYLVRDLDDAIKLIEQIPNYDDLRFYQLAATIYMLNDLPDEATFYINKAYNVSPDNAETIRLKKRISILFRNKSQKRISSARWPVHMVSPDSLKEFCKKHIVGEQNSNITLGRQPQIATIGSCFANNLANALSLHGIDSKTFSLVEEINNTYTNLEIFKIMTQHQEEIQVSSENDNTTLDPLINETFINEVKSFKEYLCKSDLLIYTLGVSQGFFTFDDQPVLIKGTGGVDRTAFTKSIYRNITVEENVKNCKKIISLARNLNPCLPIVFTISPVPLARSFDTVSAVTSDCLSKSILRVAVDELLTSEIKNIHYWPSFEIAKWIAPHVSMDEPKHWHFGSDDLYSRHVSSKTVSLIIELFLDVFCHIKC